MGQNENLLKEILLYNDKQSREFMRMAADRKRFVVVHPTKIIVFACMDGRINFPLCVGLPFGIVSSFRSLGAVFDLGDPRFSKTLKMAVKGVLSEDRDCLFVATYHYSKGDKYRGCKGWNYDTEASIAGAEKLCAELGKMFAAAKNRVCSVTLGIETDEDRFIVSPYASPEKIPASMRKDIGFILAENAKHVSNLPKRTEKEMCHGEHIIAVGTGFDWIHSYNKAVIIGPWSEDLSRPVGAAAGIILSNIKEGRISEGEGAMLVCSAVSKNTTMAARALAEKDAKALSERCVKIIASHAPELVPYLAVLAGTTDSRTRKFLPVR